MKAFTFATSLLAAATSVVASPVEARQTMTEFKFDSFKASCKPSKAVGCSIAFRVTGTGVPRTRCTFEWPQAATNIPAISSQSPAKCEDPRFSFYAYRVSQTNGPMDIYDMVLVTLFEDNGNRQGQGKIIPSSDFTRKDNGGSEKYIGPSSFTLKL